MSTQGKVAFITGANKGIGLETARGLGQLGIAVVIGSRDEAKGRAAADKLKAEGIEDIEAVRFDVTNLEDHRAIARHFEERHGKLDILVNNAGVALDEAVFGTPGGFNTTSTVSQEILQATFETNFFAVIALTQTLLPLLRNAPAGRIVNIASIVGSTGNAGQANYAAAKAGLVGMSKALAQELGARGVTVNVVAPGFIRTPMTDVLNEAQRAKLTEAIPLGRMGDPADVAAAVVYLASDEAAWATGATLHVNGGMAML